MTVKTTTTSKTEADLEARTNLILRQAMPWLDVAGVKHQLTFSFKLGHNVVPIDGTKSSSRQGRLDILIESAGQPLAILELKRPDKPLAKDDVEQGLSYARVLHPRPPIVVVSNGKETRTYATHSGELLDGGVSSEQAFADLMKSALTVAESDLADAIATLMGPRSDVWMAAVRAATDLTIAELTGDWNDASPTFTHDFHISRKAASLLEAALRGSRRVVAVEGAPLVGKTHVLREVALRTQSAGDMAVLFVEASGAAASGIAEEVARLIGAAVGWRIGAVEARDWMLSLGASDGPALVIAIDALGLEHDGIRHELEALTAKSAGARLKFVVEADTSVIDRLWLGETRRKATVFARRGERILVERLDDDEFKEALKVLGRVHVSFMAGADKADEYRQPWLLRSMASSVATSPEVKKSMTALLPPLLSIYIFRHTRDQFSQAPLKEQAAAFAGAVLSDYCRGDRPAEIALRSMHNFMVRKAAMRDHVDTADLAAMERSGLIGTVLDSGNRPLFTGRIPELIASELSRLIAARLDARTGDEEADAAAADWLVRMAARLPLGDVIGAQALADLAELQFGISVAFLNRLLERRPNLQRLNPGTRAVAWIPELGQLDLATRADGVTIVRTPGWPKGIEISADEGGQIYADVDAWLILSHVAGVPIGAFAADDPDGAAVLINPAILAAVGASPIPLRRASEFERSGYHAHEAPDGGSLLCRKDGIIEPVTLSLLRFLEHQQGKADAWLDEACGGASAALLNRIAQALTQLASMNPAGSIARWAQDSNEQRIVPALERLLTTSS